MGLNGIKHYHIKLKNTKLFYFHTWNISVKKAQKPYIYLGFIIAAIFCFLITIFSRVFFLEWLYSFVHGSSREPHWSGEISPGEWSQPKHSYWGELYCSFLYTRSHFPLTLYSDRLKSEDFSECFENFHPFISMSCIYEPYNFFLHTRKTKVKCSGSGEKGWNPAWFIWQQNFPWL